MNPRASANTAVYRTVARRPSRAHLAAQSVALTMLLCPPSVTAQDAQPSTADVDFFETRIRPVLVKHCYECHSADSETLQGNLRLDTREAMRRGGDTGPAVTPHDVDASLLVGALRYEGLEMPPEGKLPETVVADFVEWIQRGAADPRDGPARDEAPSRDAGIDFEAARAHWAYQPIRRPAIPDVRDAAWPASPIDSFVLARLEAAGLAPSATADRRTLIRRATYDIHGLPPTFEEVSAFVNDTEPGAYERVIERLLASPRYGEHWGRHWLDVARYSDTKGYVYEREERHFVHSSLYRDWVIRAFNDDLPYDRFVLLQLAADQVAPDDPSALAAMGFLTLGRRFLGVTPDIIDDRIDVVSRGLLGLTVGCARCHDHKYDPIPTADYYSLYGVFQNCTERQVAIPRQPDAAAPSADFEKGLQERWQKLQDLTATYRADANDRIRVRLKDYLLAQRELEKYPELTFNQLITKDELISGLVRRWQSLLAIAEKDSDPVFAAWIAFNRLRDDEFANRSHEVTQQLHAEGAKLNPRVAEAFSQPPSSIAEVAERYAALLANVDAQWQALCESAKRENRPAPEALPDADDQQLRQAFYGPNSPCVIPDEPLVDTEWYWDYATLLELWKAQKEYDQWLLQSPASSPSAVVLNDRPDSVDPHVFQRGNPANKGEIVPRQFLQVIAGSNRQPFTKGSGRLKMAQAIVDPANPLTARVWVNRIWLHHFGAGLVTTASDFGARATPPSHPELLDWLATELIEHGWSTKALHRAIMLSAAYRQGSRGPAGGVAFTTAQERDPENRLLWRMNPRRLSFEQFRDTLLSLSGELDLTMGGKGADLFGLRRSIYVTIDRQFLPTVLSVFDFANPDLHSPQRTETTTSQQALFGLNHPYVAGRARQIAARVAADTSDSSADVASRIYRLVLQRDPSPAELQAANQYLVDAENNLAAAAPPTNTKDWSYGFGELDELSGQVKSFQPLPHFTNAAWQGGPKWPDATLGWVQLTALGGHTGNDHQHAAVRRWTATTPGTVTIKSEIDHPFAPGDGVRCWIVSSRHGVLKSAAVHNRRERLDVESLGVEPGDTIDFVVDVAGNLNCDQFAWVPTMTQAVSGTASLPETAPTWNAAEDFFGPPMEMLSPTEQFIQLLLISNELMFVD